ncbi:hypothetical protein GW17_00052930 [Ensete ventricosum]|nr:hypothetical protein GW17_00052930 [Ensete ventricosum]
MGESEMKATQDGHDLSDFKYSCIGYSIFMDNNDNSTDKQEHRAQLPFCAGIKLLVEKSVSTTDHVAAPVQKEGTLNIMKFSILYTVWKFWFLECLFT